MQHRRPPVPVIVIILIALAVGGYYGLRTMNNAADGILSASGSIEATTVNVSPELSGRVTEVLVEEGQAVRAGDLLFRLDGSLLAAQRSVAAAVVDTAKSALASAQTNHDLILQNALAKQQSLQASDWRFSAPDEFNQPAWYFTRGEQIPAARAEVEAARQALDEASANLLRVITDLSNIAFVAAETRLANARASYLVADTVKTNADYAAEGGGLQRAADASYNAALAELRAAQNEYNGLLSSQAARDVQDARGALVVAQQRYDAAQARMMSIQTGADSPAVLTAARALEQAKTGVAQAEANLAQLDTQIAKLYVSAPMDAIVLTRNVEPGEFVQPGGTAFILGQLGDLTITVYVPEDRYGEISIGQEASVTVDSFPGMTFSASVTRIADQAEFTPRNVQTAEGRSGTVYAIELRVDDPEGRLKIGMPADVTFK